MPFKDPQKALEYRQKYYQENREKLIKEKTEYNKIYQRTPYGKFMMQRKDAINLRKLEWQLTFEEWWQIWQDSGHWEDRGSVGYHMCRYKDEGPYSIDNVYIAHHLINKKHQYDNGHTHKLPPPNFKLNKEQRTELGGRLQNYTVGLAKELAKEYGLSIHTIYGIKSGKTNYS